MFTVRSSLPLNLNTNTDGSGIIHVPSKVNTLVPDDVRDHPAFELLKKDGFLIEVDVPVAQSETDLDALASKDASTGSMGDNEAIVARKEGLEDVNEVARDDNAKEEADLPTKNEDDDEAEDNK